MKRQARYIGTGTAATLAAVLLATAFSPLGMLGDMQFSGVALETQATAVEVDLAEPLNPGQNQINTWDKTAVRTAYLTRYAKNDVRIPQSQNASAAACQPGQVIPAGVGAALESWNFLRGLNGLNAVFVDTNSAITRYAQAAAMTQARNGRLSHYPAQDRFACASNEAQIGSRHGNLAQSTGHTPAQQMLWYYIDYSVAPSLINDTMGHRLFMQDPQLSQSGIGVVDSYTAVQVRTGEGYPGIPASALHNPQAPTPQTLQWPSAGYFPKQLLPSLQDGQDLERFTFSVYGADLSQAQVSVTGPNGQPVPAQVVRPGQPGVQFTPRAIAGYSTVLFKIPAVTGGNMPQGQEEKTYRVTVSNVRGSAQPSFTYEVRLFDPETPIANQAPQIQMAGTAFVSAGYRMPEPLPVKVSGWPMPSLQWQQRIGGGVWQNIEGANSAAYVPDGGWDASRAANTTFRLVAKNSGGTVASPDIRVQVQESAQIASQQVGRGGTVNWMAPAKFDPWGQVVGTNYQWQRKNGAGQWEPIPEGGPWAGTRTANLILRGATSAQNGTQIRLEVRSHTYKLRGYTTMLSYSNEAAVSVG